MPGLRHIAAVVIVAFTLGGCAALRPSFTGYHPMGGEYLFAFDKDACEAKVTSAGLVMDADIQGPFFQCMHQRGYYLVDSDGGVVQTPGAIMTAQRQAAATH
jgi:hypothetical protein